MAALSPAIPHHSARGPRCRKRPFGGNVFDPVAGGLSCHRAERACAAGGERACACHALLRWRQGRGRAAFRLSALLSVRPSSSCSLPGEAISHPEEGLERSRAGGRPQLGDGLGPAL